MTLFYRAFIERVLAFSLCHGLKIGLKEQNSLNQIIKGSGLSDWTVSAESGVALRRRLQRIDGSMFSDDSHPLVTEFNFMPLDLES